MSDLVERLEPCPFCAGIADDTHAGGAPELHEDSHTNIYVWCPSCGAKGLAVVGAHGGTPEEAVAAWNRRAESPKLPGLRSEVERLTRERDEAYGYASRFLTSFVAQHCNPVPGWAPLHDLIGVLTQIDNASTVAREYRSELTTLTARTREVLAPFAAEAARHFGPDDAGVWFTHANFRVGHLRAANTLFNELKEKDNG